MEIPITFTQAALGAELEIPTLEGTMKYNIPEGTQTGTVFRLKNKGIKHLRSNAKGDQFIKVTVEVPTKLSAKQKELLKQFAEISGDEVFQQRKLSLKNEGFVPIINSCRIIHSVRRSILVEWLEVAVTVEPEFQETVS